MHIVDSATLLNAVTVTGVGDAVRLRGPATFQAYVVGTGSVGATIKIQVANIAGQWLDAGTITLSGTTSATDGFALAVPWALCRANCTAISGTGATLTVAVGGL